MTDVPDFRRMWQAACVEASRRRRRRRRVLAAASAAPALAGILVLWGLSTRPARDPEWELRLALEVSRQIESWEGPLDVLLSTPGQAWLETTPQFGVVEVEEWIEEGATS
jgi:hypothetical protein